MNKKELPSQEDINMLFEYHDGILYWRNGNGKGVKTGDSAGCIQTGGYIRVKINGKAYAIHRIIWVLHHGKMLIDEEIDHINCNKTDNRIENLRLATKTQNKQNQRKPNKSNKLGVLGVSIKRDKFRTNITINGKKKHIGTFKTKELAYEAYLKAKREFHEYCTL